MARLRDLADPEAAQGMARFGINPDNTLGISIPNLRGLAKEIGKDHALALELWATAVHEARILASMVDDFRAVDVGQMERWVRDFDSWDVCDQCIANLFEDVPGARERAFDWSSRPEEFVRRAGFVMMARLAVSNKKASDGYFFEFLSVIARGAVDQRNFVKKAVNWALRQIGKRSPGLNAMAIDTAMEIQKLDSPPAKWIAADALRELKGEAVQKRLNSVYGR